MAATGTYCHQNKPKHSHCTSPGSEVRQQVMATGARNLWPLCGSALVMFCQDLIIHGQWYSFNWGGSALAAVVFPPSPFDRDVTLQHQSCSLTECRVEFVVAFVSFIVLDPEHPKNNTKNLATRAGMAGQGQIKCTPNAHRVVSWPLGNTWVECS